MLTNVNGVSRLRVMIMADVETKTTVEKEGYLVIGKAEA